MSLELSTLSRMTLSYNVDEDRVILVGELKTGQVVSLVLTQRLLNQLVPHLLKAADSLRTSDASFGGDTKESLQGSNAPVQVKDLSNSILVTAVDLTKASGCVVLDWMNNAGDRKVRLVLDQGSLNPWLAAVKHCFVRGSWSIKAWQAQPPKEIGSDGERFTVH